MCFDILRRVLSDYFNYDVHYCMNITDIDDKVSYVYMGRKGRRGRVGRREGSESQSSNINSFVSDH